ncbi:hypothetical protein PJ985_08275 [Streptomyces sp. ACA25]|uniref:hypothetical protein n=1 Tax=Streptomyces sp. ACA25 TaxID=3022596 RepID=UPI002307C18A|nr:hypothetical protein [Streptomyces sp. ACA25]MDB1087561.1 hypothetical protein [Streptomyces sp. ACA25]
MAGFLDRAKDQAQRGLEQGRKKVDEIQAQRTGSELLRKLGTAYYEQQRRDGSPEAVQRALTQLERHIEENGDGFLKGTAD